MKTTLLALIFTLSAQSVFAEGLTCFNTSKSNIANVPSQLCLSDLGVYNNGDKEWIGVFGGNMAGEYELRAGVNGQQSAILTLKTIDEGTCEYYEKTSIVIKLNADYLSTLNAKTIQVSVEKESMNDSCHSYLEVEEIPFQIESQLLR